MLLDLLADCFGNVVWGDVASKIANPRVDVYHFFNFTVTSNLAFCFYYFEFSTNLEF